MMWYSRKNVGGYLAVLVAGLVLLLPACGASNAPASAPPTATGSAPASSVAAAKAQLSKTGHVIVADANTASILTGYTVTTPSTIPDGFVPVEYPGGAFNVWKPGNPTDTHGDEYPYSVTVAYSLTGNLSNSVPFFMITESRNKIGIAGGVSEPVRIGQNTGEEFVLSNSNPPRLALSWSNGAMYYDMQGLLLGPLDKAGLIAIAASMK